VTRDRFASPSARQLAASLELDGGTIVGTGHGGAITVSDVRAAAPQTPDDLGDHGAALYRVIDREWKLRSDELALLLAAARTVDELAILESALAASSPVVEGSRGQVRAHPLVSQVREHRLTLRLLLSSLRLESREDAAEKSDGAERSNAGRKLALIRHNG